METPMQELIKWIDNGFKPEINKFDKTVVKEKAIELLEKEKQVIIEANYNGIKRADLYEQFEEEDMKEYSEQYYSEIFGSK